MYLGKWKQGSNGYSIPILRETVSGPTAVGRYFVPHEALLASHVDVSLVRKMEGREWKWPSEIEASKIARHLEETLWG